MWFKDVPKEKGWDEPRQLCKQVPKEKAMMNLVQYARIFPRWCARIFQRKNVGMSLDNNAMMCQEKSAMILSGSILTISLYKNVTLSMFLNPCIQ